MRDQAQIIINKFKGLYRNGSLLDIPEGYSTTCDNIEFTRNSMKSRSGFIVDAAYGGFPFVRILNYQRSDSPVSPRYFILNNQGDLFDTGFSLFTPIITVAGAVDFSVISQYNRAYISFHNRVRGKLNTNVYVWDPSIMTVAREAGGTAPVTGPTAATGAAGNVAGGKHLISVAFETNTGFITKPGPSTQYTAPGNAQINLTAIPTGTVGTVVKRHILVTPIILSYDGNPQHYEHFFVATIADNTTTILTINFIDSALVQSADYLFDQLVRIPAGVGFCIFQGCLVSMGENLDTTVTPNVERGFLLRVSKSGQPESHSAVDGFVQVDPADGGGCKAGSEFRGLLYIAKSARWYTVQPNDGPPNTWLVIQIDTGIGCECFGLANILDDQGAVTADSLFLASRQGIYNFSGTFGEVALTEAIKDYYASLEISLFNQFQLLVDPTGKLIYLLVAEDATPNYKLLVGNYEEGLDPSSIKWSLWFVTGKNFNSILLDTDTNLQPVLKALQGTSSTLYARSVTAQQDNDGAFDIPIAVNWISFPMKFSEYGPSQFTGIYVIVKPDVFVASNSVRCQFASPLDATVSTSVTMALVSTRSDRRGLYNYIKDFAQVQLDNPNSSVFEMTRMIVTGNPHMEEYPQ